METESREVSGSSSSPDKQTLMDVGRAEEAVFLLPGSSLPALHALGAVCVAAAGPEWCGDSESFPHHAEKRVLHSFLAGFLALQIPCLFQPVTLTDAQSLKNCQLEMVTKVLHGSVINTRLAGVSMRTRLFQPRVGLEFSC